MSGRGPTLTKKNSRSTATAERVAKNIVGAAIGLNKTSGATYKLPPKSVQDVKKQLVQPTSSKLAKRAPRIAQITSAASGSDLTDIKLSELAYAIFGESYVDELKKNEIIRTVRDIWELSSPTTQCENTIGRLEKGKTPCWICSLPITDVYGLTAECEHVLPIAQAVVYIGLYSTAAAKGIFPKDMTMLGGVSKEYLLKEYKWAHQVCNQVKNDDSYLDFNSTTQKYVVRKDKIVGLLQRIKTNSRSDGKAIKPLITSSVINRAVENATNIFQEVCNFLNGYNAPRLLELAGLVSAGYGPRKASVNPRWEQSMTSISSEEIAANMRREIIKANMEYSGIAKKTLEKVSSLPRISPNAGPIFLKIIENRRPEYVSLFMRIKPTQTNMNHLIAYIRQQLFSEFANVDGKELGIKTTSRKDAQTAFREILKTNNLLSTIKTSPEFNEELMKANKIYQEDITIGDNIRKILEEYTHEYLTDDDKLQIQSDLSSELVETSGDSDPINPESEYAQMLLDIKSINTSAVSDIGTIVSDPAGSWVDNSDGLMDLLNSTDYWDVDEKNAVNALIQFGNKNVKGGRRTRRRCRR